MPGKPKVACMEEYDSDGSHVKPGTRKEARRRQTTSGPPKAIDRYRTAPRDGASDSGYSSRTSGTQDSNASASAAATLAAMPPPPRPATINPQVRSKPIIHRSDSQRSRPKAPSRSGSMSRPAEQCTDPNCRDPNCMNARMAGRRNSAGYGYPVQYPTTQYTSSPMQYQAVPQYQYQYTQAPQVTTPQPAPQMAPQPRPRSGSTSRQARPSSMYGYAFPSTYNAAPTGPPPANSAYQAGLGPEWTNSQWYQLYLQQQQQQPQPQPQQAYRTPAYGTTPPTQTVPLYTPASPATTSPTSPNYPTTSGLNRTFSARIATANTTPSYDQSSIRFAAPLNRTISARQPGGRASTIPGAFPADDSSESSSESEESSADLSDEEYERTRRSRARDSRLMSSSSQRRPSMSKQYTSAPAVPTQSSREMLRRNPRSDTVLDYISSSDNMDSDRTARAVVSRAHTNYSTSTRSSRRPSVSTTASGRTKSTNMSSATSGMASMVIEDRKGRNVSYLSRRDQESLSRKLQQQQLWDDEQRQRQRIEDYQNAVSGQQSPEVTAENIRAFQLRRNPSNSGHSRKTSRSSSKSKVHGAGGGGDGIKIESGGTVIHVYGGERIEVQTAEDGAQRVVVGGGGGSTRGEDSAYHGSKSSSSRVGRSRGGSEVGGSKRKGQKIREEREEDGE